MFIDSLFNTDYFDNPETKDMFDDVDDDLLRMLMSQRKQIFIRQKIRSSIR